MGALKWDQSRGSDPEPPLGNVLVTKLEVGEKDGQYVRHHKCPRTMSKIRPGSTFIETKNSVFPAFKSIVSFTLDLRTSLSLNANATLAPGAN